MSLGTEMNFSVFYVLLAFVLCAFDVCEPATTIPEPDKDVDYYIDRCLAGKYHKEKPGPESDLFGQCTPWKDRSCCTDEITQEFHENPTWHDFDWNHCDTPLSSSCINWLMKDLCFYECSPNVGPWLVPHDISIRDERYVNVPLCQSQCDSWYEACRLDYTCKANWGKGWNWTTGENECPTDSTCQTFETVYGSATNMCETIWDEAYTVVPDSESCMVLWFDGTDNPNEEVALARAEELAGGATSMSISLLPLTIASMASALWTRW